MPPGPRALWTASRPSADAVPPFLPVSPIFQSGCRLQDVDRVGRRKRVFQALLERLFEVAANLGLPVVRPPTLVTLTDRHVFGLRMQGCDRPPQEITPQGTPLFPQKVLKRRILC